MPNNVLWRTKFKGKIIEIRESDLEVGNLRQAEAWFGDGYGSFTGFISKLVEWNVDAVACALWMVKKAAGEETGDPRSDIEFSFADFEAAPEAKAKKAPAKPGKPTPTGGSTVQSES